jgi:hypothetical protein
MHRSPTPNRFTKVSWMALWALLAGLVGDGGCAKDTVSPGIEKVDALSDVWSQILVPWEDVSNPGGFTSTTGQMWSALDESSCNDDADYILRDRFGLPPTISQATVRITNPVGTGGGYLKVRWKVIGNYSTFVPNPTSLYYELYSGSTQLAVHTVYPNGSNYVSDSVWANVANGNGMTIRLTMTLKPTHSYDQIEGRITCAQVEIP